MYKIAIVIPVYKSFQELNEYEIASLNQTMNSLSSDNNVLLIGPKNLQKDYNTILPLTKYLDFSKKYFGSIQGYNKLLKSKSFYKRFEDYDFILIAQTDAWIFGSSKELLNFTHLDFSGAISLHNNEHHGYNGGLSLRNVQASIWALESLKNYETPKEIWRRHFPENKLSKSYKIISFLLDVTIRKKVHHRLNFFTKGNEDLFWSVNVPKAVPSFKVNDFETALKFSWEHKCAEFYNNYPLPFGCHGWWNYNYDFWKDIIKIDERQDSN
jgi:hypothetical protein